MYNLFSKTYIEMLHILQIIFIMHYIFLVFFFGTIKNFKFQSYYSNLHSLKRNNYDNESL